MSSLDKTFQLIIKLFLTKTPLPVISLELANCLHIFVCFPLLVRKYLQCRVWTPTLTPILPVCQAVMLAGSDGEGGGGLSNNRVGWNITKYYE